MHQAEFRQEDVAHTTEYQVPLKRGVLADFEMAHAQLTVSRWEGVKPSPSGDTLRYTVADGKLPNIRAYTF